MSEKPKEYSVRRGAFKDKKVKDLSINDMRIIIHSMRRTADADAGAKMMEFILDRKGVAGVVEFVEWGQKILDNTGMILKSDFLPIDGSEPTKEEKKMLRSATPGLSRRSFLFNVAPWCAVAATGAVHSAAGMLEDLAGQATGDQTASGPKNIFGKIRQEIDNKGGYPLEMIGSVSLAYLAINDWNDDKYQQISNGVAEIGQILGISERMTSYRLNLPSKRAAR
jgi:hypothetical protein